MQRVALFYGDAYRDRGGGFGAGLILGGVDGQRSRGLGERAIDMGDQPQLGNAFGEHNDGSPRRE